jgi:hypothetical protein
VESPSPNFNHKHSPRLSRRDVRGTSDTYLEHRSTIIQRGFNPTNTFPTRSISTRKSLCRTSYGPPVGGFPYFINLTITSKTLSSSTEDSKDDMLILTFVASAIQGFTDYVRSHLIKIMSFLTRRALQTAWPSSRIRRAIHPSRVMTGVRSLLYIDTSMRSCLSCDEKSKTSAK